MDRELIDPLEQCLIWIEIGRSVEECLLEFPQYTDELEPLLSAAKFARGSGPHETPTNVMARSRNALLAQAGELHSSVGQAPLIASPLRRIAFGLTAGFLVFTASTITLSAASAQSLPGDVLYPVKRAVEHLRLEFGKERERQSLMENFRSKRVEETLQVLERSRIEQVTYFGILDSRSVDTWLIGGIPVIVDSRTIIDDAIMPGDLLVIEGITSTDGELLASTIKRQGFEISGVLEALDGSTWWIDGVEIEARSSEYKNGGELHLGLFYTVRVDVGEDGKLRLVAVDLSQEEPNVVSSNAREEDETLQEEERLQEFSITGTLEARTNGYWRVAGIYLLISEQTDIEDNIIVGDKVEVKALRMPSGVVLALSIDRVNAEGELEGNKPEDETGSEPEEAEDENEHEPEDD